MKAVVLTYEQGKRIQNIAEFDSIKAAEDAIAVIEQYDPKDVYLGNYGIDANETAVTEYELARGGR